MDLFMFHLGDFVLGFSFALWTFTVLLGMVVRTAGEGRPQVIGSLQPIVATLGDDAILPCHVEPLLNVEELTVQWWRPDVPPDPTDPLSNYKYVHSYHNSHDEEDMKMPLYAGRTALLKDELKHGNVSLQIRNVKLSDEGRYRCQIPQLGSASVIKLVVEVISVETTPHHPGNPQTPDPKNETHFESGLSNQGLWIFMGVACVVPTLGVGVVGYLLKHRREKQNHSAFDVAPA
ncbi:butyrophilin subfamily 1 member A1-like [Epinephelus moara]|uniref:butyrophilin subfamily 1 member A1-like n=1 Tax=Epinephelus moara TaxID=300413 RepID=UPI00214F272C|nr:butyrophilin subfamily 1 member A1-like [Epinephelus moara]